MTSTGESAAAPARDLTISATDGYALAATVFGGGEPGQSPVTIIAPAAAVLAAGLAGEPLLAHWTQTFMGSAAQFLAQFFPLFLLGALFGKLMDDSGSVTAMLGAAADTTAPTSNTTCMDTEGSGPSRQPSMRPRRTRRAGGWARSDRIKSR